jgi:hypothetical protein
MNYDLYNLVMEMMSGDEEATMRWMNNPKDWLSAPPIQAWENEEEQRKIISWIMEMSKYRA